jgi:DNA-binding response OmpR family regulator
MKRQLRVLVVMSHPAAASATRGWVERCGYHAEMCRDFTTATSQLRGTPDLVIAEVRLGAFNGLHVAMRARWEGIPAIVIGPDDTVLRKEAVSLGISYVTPDVHEHAMAALVDTLATMRLARLSAVSSFDETEVVDADRPAAVA